MRPGAGISFTMSLVDAGLKPLRAYEIVSFVGPELRDYRSQIDVRLRVHDVPEGWYTLKLRKVEDGRGTPFDAVCFLEARDQQDWYLLEAVRIPKGEGYIDGFPVWRPMPGRMEPPPPGVDTVLRVYRVGSDTGLGSSLPAKVEDDGRFVVLMREPHDGLHVAIAFDRGEVLFSQTFVIQRANAMDQLPPLTLRWRPGR